jgi:hypothetical protein
MRKVVVFALALVAALSFGRSATAADSIFEAYLHGLVEEAGRETFRQVMQYLLTDSTQSSSYSRSTQPAYTVVFNGSSGVNVRETPGGRIIAAAQNQRIVPIGGLSTPVMHNRLPWVQVEIVGWMARKKHSRVLPYFAELGGGVSRVIWDGNGNPNDNFIALKALPDISSTRAAKVFTGTDVYTGTGVVNGAFEWVPARLVGWMALRSSKGATLLARTN